MISYRNAELNDVCKVAELSAKCFADNATGHSEKHYTDFVNANMPFVLAFESEDGTEGKLVGAAVCGSKSSVEENSLSNRSPKSRKRAEKEELKTMDFELISVFVLPECRGNGIGSALAEKVIEEASKQSGNAAKYIFCYMSEANEKPQKFFKKNGFKVYDHRDSQVILFKNLKPGIDHIIYREATLEDMRNVALIHERCFQNYFLTKLGTDLLEQYYTEYLLQKQPFLVAVDPEQKEYGGLVSEILYYYKGCDARAQFESKNKVALAKRLLLLCLKFDKGAISRCWAKVTGKFKRQSVSSDREYMDLDALSQVLLPEYRGSGISSELHNRVIEWAKEHSDKPIHHIAYYINDDNPASIKLHEKNGCYLYEKRGHQLIYMKDI